MHYSKLLLIIFIVYLHSIAQHAVTFVWEGGRFGDHLKCFASALWFSKKHNIPFLYPYFPLSEYLMLTGLEQYNPELHHFDTYIKYTQAVESLLEKSTESILIKMRFKYRPNFSFQNQALRISMQQCISPKKPLKKIKIPEGFLSVAMHVRTGGNFVTDQEKKNQQPLRFAPLSYYINQINYLTSIYPNRHLYIHLFTDDENPKNIITYLQEHISHTTIQYGFRIEENQTDQAILEDFFNMMDFEILIQSQSGFSTMAAYLGNQRLIIKPTKSTYIDSNTWHITEVEVTKKCDGKILAKKRISYQRVTLR